MTTVTTTPTEIPVGRRRRSFPGLRPLLLVATLIAAIAAYALSGEMRARMGERVWLHRLDVGWAEELQKEALERRKLRADLRTELRKLVQDPEAVEPTLRAAACYGQLGEYDDALFLLREAERLSPQDPQVYRAQFEVYISQGKYDRCIEVVERGLEVAPDDLELNLQRVDLDAILGWAQEARPRITRLLSRHGDKEARVHLMAALLAKQIADARSSEQHLQEALRLDPKNHRIYALLSGLDSELGRKDASSKHIRLALELNPKNADYWIHLAELQRLGAGSPEQRFKEAEKSYRRALELSPTMVAARHGMAVCMIEQGQGPEGQAILEQILKSNPYLPLPLLDLGNLYVRQGRRQEGQELLNRYQEGMEQNSELKGRSLRAAMLPKDASAFSSMGELHLRTGAPEKAIVFFRRALRLNPKDNAVRQSLAQSLVLADRGPEIPEVTARP